MAPLPPTGYALIVAIVLSLLAVRWLAAPETGWLSILRERFVVGIPWGSLLTIAGVLAVYLFVQGGFEHWRKPVVIPFRAWSYLYPLGVLTAGFTHTGPGHLIGNLVGTASFAPVAEYAWGHYPRRRGSSSFSSLSTTPVARILAVPVAAFVIGVLASTFALGPVIGFSTVVFAFAGFAIVRYPLATVMGLLSGQVLQLTYNALRNPVTTRSAHPGFFSPGFARIAVQGHAIGLLMGVVLGIGLALARDEESRPAAARVWLAVLLLAVVQSLWAVYWFRGEGTYVLYRALGVALVFVLAAVVAAAATATDRDDLAAIVHSDSIRTARRVVPALVLVVALVGLSAPAVPANLRTIADQTPVGIESSSANAPLQPVTIGANGANATNATDTTNAALTLDGVTAGPVGDGVTIRGYTVTYAENVTNKEISVINVSVFNVSTDVDTSGAIVRNPSRHIWTTGVSAKHLKFTGTAWVRVGGYGWRSSVRVQRRGWTTAGGPIAYRVLLKPADGSSQLSYTSGLATAEPVIKGRNVTIGPTTRGFSVIVARPDGVFSRAPLPENGANVTLANLTIGRDGDGLYAAAGDTRVRVATKEQYH